MRSIYSHLEAVKSFGEDASLIQKPTFRSSAIFPVLRNNEINTEVIFMGYWLLKRHIKEVSLLYTLRNQSGKILSRKNAVISSYKAFSISLNEFNIIDTEDFIGSLELEIFSTRDLVFPYPAFVLVYSGKNFSTAVHTVGRIYNDIEDLTDNEEYVVPESGFDVYNVSGTNSFIAFTNGPIAIDEPTFDCTIIQSGKLPSINKTFQIKPIKPFETVWINLDEVLEFKKLNLVNELSITLRHNLKGIFPRFVSGNFDQLNKAISITHSYYDSSELSDEKSFWNRIDEGFNDSAVAIPLYLENDFYTKVIVYPIFSPSNFDIGCNLYNENGDLIKTVDHIISINSNNKTRIELNFEEICIKNNVSVSAVKVANLVCNWENKKRIPTRVKFGLNVGKKSGVIKLPSNICFAPSLGNPKILNKKSTFRWAPFVNHGESEIAISNCSTLKRYDKPANVTLKFFRQVDEQTIEKKIEIPANGVVFINSIKDEELKIFYQNQSGWMTMESENPFIYGFYFDFFDSGSVAADHIF